MKPTDQPLATSTSHLAVLIDRTMALLHVGLLGSRLAKAAPTPRCASRCRWRRVARQGWVDHALSFGG